MGRTMMRPMTMSHHSYTVQIPSWTGSVNAGQDDETRNGLGSLPDGQVSCRAVMMASSKPSALEKTPDQDRMRSFGCLP